MSDENKQGIKKKIISIYELHYKKLMLIPLTILILSILQIGLQTAITGDFVRKGISLSGGITVTIPTEDNIDIKALQNDLSAKFSQLDITVRNLINSGISTGIIIESDIDIEHEDTINAFISSIGDCTGFSMKTGTYNIETMGSTLGTSFFFQILIAILIAFLFMSFIVFLYFRSPIPCFAVILSAFTDIMFALAMFNIFQMKLSTAGIAAFLMLIGYSVDTDILLATKIIKRRGGTVLDRTFSAMKTGFTTNMTTVAAVLIAIFMTQSDAIRQIMIILLFGLIMDIPSTWLQNAGILRSYMARKEKRRLGAGDMQ